MTPKTLLEVELFITTIVNPSITIMLYSVAFESIINFAEVVTCFVITSFKSFIESSEVTAGSMIVDSVDGLASLGFAIEKVS